VNGSDNMLREVSARCIALFPHEHHVHTSASSRRVVALPAGRLGRVCALDPALIERDNYGKVLTESITRPTS